MTGVTIVAMLVGVLAAPSFAVQKPVSSALVAEGPWVRQGQQGRSTAGYLVLVNRGTRDNTIVGARSSAAKTVELHEMTMAGSMMRMRKLDRLELPAGGRIELVPGGRHLMFIGLNERLAPGATVRVTLVLASGEELPVEFEVRKSDAS